MGTSTAAIQVTPVVRRPMESFQSWRQLREALLWAKRVFITLSVVMIALLALEIVRTYQTLSGMHPALGIAMLIGVGLGLALVIAPAWRFLRMPKVVEPPPLPAPQVNAAPAINTPANCTYIRNSSNLITSNCH